MHGGKTPRGAESVHFKHGLRSRHPSLVAQQLSTTSAEQIEQIIKRGFPLDQARAIAILLVERLLTRGLHAFEALADGSLTPRQRQHLEQAITDALAGLPPLSSLERAARSGSAVATKPGQAMPEIVMIGVERSSEELRAEIARAMDEEMRALETPDEP